MCRWRATLTRAPAAPSPPAVTVGPRNVGSGRYSPALPQQPLSSAVSVTDDTAEAQTDGGRVLPVAPAWTRAGSLRGCSASDRSGQGGFVRVRACLLEGRLVHLLATARDQVAGTVSGRQRARWERN